MSGRSDEDSLLKRKVIEILKKKASILLFFEQNSDDCDNPSCHRAFHHYLTR
jgi:hypothetical protein